MGDETANKPPTPCTDPRIAPHSPPQPLRRESSELAERRGHQALRIDTSVGDETANKPPTPCADPRIAPHSPPQPLRRQSSELAERRGRTLQTLSLGINTDMTTGSAMNTPTPCLDPRIDAHTFGRVRPHVCSTGVRG